MNLLIGIVFIVSDFVVTVFPKVTAKLVGVWQRTGPSSSRLPTTRELEGGTAPKFLLRKTAVSPVQVASKIVSDNEDDRRGANGDMSPEIRENNPTPLSPTRVVHMDSSMFTPQVEAGCIDHNHDILEQGSYPRDGEAQGFVHCPTMKSFMVKSQVEAGCMDHDHDTVDQGFVRGRETQWNGNLKQNLDRSAVALPVEETIPVKRTSKAGKRNL